jgi:hypothetical protein
MHRARKRANDYYWSKLSADPRAEQCGWLKDAYGVSWQVVPRMMSEIFKEHDEAALKRVTAAFLKMKKFDIAELTKEEKDSGLSTGYPLKGVTIAAILSPKGELVLNVNDQFNETTGGACKISILKAQLLATAKQFDEVTTVTVQPPTVFQP